MENIVPLIKSFKTIFYFKFFELENVLFGLNEVLMIFEIIWKLLNQFDWFEPCGTVAVGPTRQPPPSPVLMATSRTMLPLPGSGRIACHTLAEVPPTSILASTWPPVEPPDPFFLMPPTSIKKDTQSQLSPFCPHAFSSTKTWASVASTLPSTPCPPPAARAPPPSPDLGWNAAAVAPPHWVLLSGRFSLIFFGPHPLSSPRWCRTLPASLPTTAHRQPSPNITEVRRAAHISAAPMLEPVGEPPLPSPCLAGSLTLTGPLPAVELHLVVLLAASGCATARAPGAVTTSGRATPPSRLDRSTALGHWVGP
jgi:hypothetical protein